LREGGLKLGLATENDLEEMAVALEEWAERDDGSLAMIHGEVSHPEIAIRPTQVLTNGNLKPGIQGDRAHRLIRQR
jgi:hypothetical protein